VRAEQLARQWRILQALEYNRHGITVADLAEEEGCHVHDEIRMFVLDRIRLLHVTDERFIPPDDFDLDTYLKDSFGVIRTDPERVVIRFDPSLERFLKENIWHPSQEFSWDNDGRVLLTMEVGGLTEVMSWVLGFGRQAEVLEPAHLRKAVAEEARAVVGRYAEGVKRRVGEVGQR
jgi:predicted DNA-binding transcriptional regulator YafY